jgi:hypothetical protein
MGAVLPVRLGFIGKLEIGIVDQHRRLQGVARSLLAHVTARETLELRLDEGDELVERARLACAPGAEQLRDLFLCGGGHFPTRN